MRWDAGPSVGPHCSGGTRADMHHGAKKSACRNTPPVKCATLNTSDRASMPAFLSGFGVLVMPPGGPVIEPLPSANLQMTRQPTGSIRSAQNSERKPTMNAINKISDTDRHAHCVETSKRVRWDIH